MHDKMGVLSSISTSFWFVLMVWYLCSSTSQTRQMLPILRWDLARNLTISFDMDVTLRTMTVSKAIHACSVLYPRDLELWERRRCTAQVIQTIRDEKLAILEELQAEMSPGSEVYNAAELLSLMYAYEDPIALPQMSEYLDGLEVENVTLTDYLYHSEVLRNQSQHIQRSAEVERKIKSVSCLFGFNPVADLLSLHLLLLGTPKPLRQNNNDSSESLDLIWVFVASPAMVPSENEFRRLQVHAQQEGKLLEFIIGDAIESISQLVKTKNVRKPICSMVQYWGASHELLHMFLSVVGGQGTRVKATTPRKGIEDIEISTKPNYIFPVIDSVKVIWIRSYIAEQTAEECTGAASSCVRVQLADGGVPRYVSPSSSGTATASLRQMNDQPFLLRASEEMGLGWWQLEWGLSALWTRFSGMTRQVSIDGCTGRHFRFAADTHHRLREVLVGTFKLQRVMPFEKQQQHNHPISTQNLGGQNLGRQTAFAGKDDSITEIQDIDSCDKLPTSCRGQLGVLPAGKPASAARALNLRARALIIISYTIRVFSETALGMLLALRTAGFENVAIAPDMTLDTLNALQNWQQLQLCRSTGAGNNTLGIFGHESATASIGDFVCLASGKPPIVQIALGPHDLSMLLPHYVAVQMEQSWSPAAFQPALHLRYALVLSRAVCVLCYSHSHTRMLRSLGYPCVRTLPFLFSADADMLRHRGTVVSQQQPQAEASDVLFFGSCSARRVAILTGLQRRFSKQRRFRLVLHCSSWDTAVFDSVRHQYVSHAQVVLNMHGDGIVLNSSSSSHHNSPSHKVQDGRQQDGEGGEHSGSVLEAHRVNYLLSMGKCVVSERGIDEQLAASYASSVRFLDPPSHILAPATATAKAGWLDESTRSNQDSSSQGSSSQDSSSQDSSSQDSSSQDSSSGNEWDQTAEARSRYGEWVAEQLLALLEDSDELWSCQEAARREYDRLSRNVSALTTSMDYVLQLASAE